MERPHYRRQSQPVSGRYGSYRSSNRNIKEIILRQCIVCGIIFAFIMLVNLIKTDFTQDIRESLLSALTGNTMVDDIKKAAGKVTGTFTNMENSVMTTLGNTTDTSKNTETPDSADQSAENEIISETPKPQKEISESIILSTPQPDFRIDEDILQEINNKIARETSD